MITGEPGTIDDYLAGVDEAKRAAPQALRGTIRAAAPEAEECIGYQMPSFRPKTGMLVSFGARKNHCALYPLSMAVIRAHAAELAGFETGKGTIRFTPDRPLPAALVTRLVAARIAENARRREEKAAARRSAVGGRRSD